MNLWHHAMPPFSGAASLLPTERGPLPPVAQQIVVDLLRRIADSHYAPGDPIPSAARLSAMYDVPLAAVNEARRRLIADGVLAIRPGVGTIVAVPGVDDDGAEEEMEKARKRLDEQIAFLRRALEDPDTGVRWDPHAGQS